MTSADPLRVLLVDPSAFTPPYDRMLGSALAALGVDVTLATSRFGYGEVPPAPGVRVDERAFYRWQPGSPGSRRRRAAKALQHVPGMRRLARSAAAADVVHFQWLQLPWLDGFLLPGDAPLVITAHDVLARRPLPGQWAAQRRLLRRADAVVVHSDHGARRLVRELDVAPERVAVIPHGAFTHLAELAGGPLPGELGGADPRAPVALFFGGLRPHKGIEVLLEAWRRRGRGAPGELWIVGRAWMDTGRLRRRSPPGVRWVERFVSDEEMAALFRRAALAVLPYEQIEQSGVVHAALAFGTPLLLTAVGGFPEIAEAGAAELVAPGDPDALASALDRLLGDRERRLRLGAAGRAAAASSHSWRRAAQLHLALYRRLIRGGGGSEWRR